MIPDKAIEAAVDALDPSWLEEATREVWRKIMQDVLEAAAPYIAEATLVEAADQAVDQELHHITPAALRRRAKSYRTAL